MARDKNIIRARTRNPASWMTKGKCISRALVSRFRGYNMRLLKYVSVLLLIVLVIACGGGGAGGVGLAPSGSSPPPPTPPAPTGTSLGITLNEGDYWEFFGTNESNSFAQPDINTSSIVVGRFRITLGPSVVIGGETAYPLIITGESQTFAPRWTHVAIGSDGSLLGSTDGVGLTTVYDAQTDQWFGGGFFVEFGPTEQVSFSGGTFDGNYNTLSALVAAHSTSSGGCEQILGITFCDDESTSFSEREFYKIGVGPIGYSLDTSFSSSGGGFFTSSQKVIGIAMT